MSPFPILLSFCLPDCPLSSLPGSLDFVSMERTVLFKCYAPSGSLRLDGPTLSLKYTLYSCKCRRLLEQDILWKPEGEDNARPGTDSLIELVG